MKSRTHKASVCCRALAAIAAARLIIATGYPQTPAPEVFIRSAPPGASVAINGKTVGITPLTIPSLPRGKHLAVVSLRGFRPVYKTIEIAPEQRVVLDFALEPLAGLLLFHSDPSGAELEINEVHRGTTPVLVTDLPPGLYRAKLTRPGFLPRLLDVTVDSRLPKRVHAALTADTAMLTVRVVPEGAEVSLDGIRRGNAPCSIENVRTGEVGIGIAAPGHRPFSETLALRAGEHRELDITLAPEPSSLSVSTTPPGARIFVNDRFRGRSPARMSGIAAGEYVIRAELEAHDTAVRTVRIGLGRDHVEDIPLTANAGRIEITTEPAGASVLLNGVTVGDTASEPGKTDNISALFILPLVPVGTHELTLAKAGYFPLVKTVDIGRNETHTAHYTLERRFIPNILVQTRTETYRGVLTERNAESLKLELRPGIFKTLRSADIIAVTPLRAPEIPDGSP